MPVLSIWQVCMSRGIISSVLQLEWIYHVGSFPTVEPYLWVYSENMQQLQINILNIAAPLRHMRWETHFLHHRAPAVVAEHSCEQRGGEVRSILLQLCYDFPSNVKLYRRLQNGTFQRVIWDLPLSLHLQRSISRCALQRISSIYLICITFPPPVIKCCIMFGYFKSPVRHTIKGHEHPVILLIIDFSLIGELLKLV